MKKINLAVNSYNFQWSFPEMVADELGLFAKEGLKVTWLDITPEGPSNKGELYTELLSSGKTDVYHAGEWACILRVLNSKGSRVVSKSVPGKGTVNSTFSLWVRKDSGYKTPRDLTNKPVAIELGTGSYYTTLQDLERFIPKGEVKTVQVGEPHKRFLALLNREVEGASLLSPWTDFGRAASLVELMRTRRDNPTTIVVREDEDVDKMRRFFAATNAAIDAINKEPGRFRELYFSKVERILEDTPDEVREMGQRVRSGLRVPLWKHWTAYGKRDFDKTYKWMVDRKLAPPGHRSIEVVAENASEMF
jgi:ABC-type nitrate/sulfonate/bicarbonate transport system substrate-binding protein